MNDFLKETNSETKKFLINAFNIIDWLNNNKESIKLNEKELTEPDIIAISIFLSAIRHSKELKEIFEKHNIIYNKLFELLKNQTQTEYELYPLDKTKIYQTYDFNTIKKDFIKNLKKRLACTNEIYIKDIEIYQILAYFMEIAFQNINKLINLNEFDKNELMNNLNEFTWQKDELFIMKLEHKDSQKIEFKEITLYFHKNGSITIKNNNKNNIVRTTLNNEPIEFNLENECLLTLINDIDANIDILQEALNEKTIKLGFYDFINDKDTEITCDTLSLFDSINKEEIKEEQQKESTTTNLDKYGKDLTKEKFLKDPSIGRDQEIRQIEQILLYPEKDKSVIIVGDSGIGKTAIIRGLAYRIQNGNVPKTLKNLKIYSISTSTLVAGTKYVGTLEEKMKKILDEASKDKNILIYIDEIHQAIGGGKTEGNNNTVSEILKPYIDYGDVRILSSTTTNEYEQYIAPDQAFKSRLKKIKINEPTDDVIYEILDDLITKYDEISYSKLNRTQEEKDLIIRWLIESTNKKFRTYNDRTNNPRLVLDILKEAYAIAAINERELITNEDLAQALLSEPRLYESSKQNQINKLNHLIPRPKTKIIQFIPKK